MKDYSPWVVEIDNGFVITSSFPLISGQLVERIITAGDEIIYSGKLKVIDCNRVYSGWNHDFYEITLKKIDDIINIEELI